MRWLQRVALVVVVVVGKVLVVLAFGWLVDFFLMYGLVHGLHVRGRGGMAMVSLFRSGLKSEVGR